MMTSLALPDRSDLSVDLNPKVTLPDLMTRARRELIVSEVFLLLRGGILSDGLSDAEMSWCCSFAVCVSVGWDKQQVEALARDYQSIIISYLSCPKF